MHVSVIDGTQFLPSKGLIECLKCLQLDRMKTLCLEFKNKILVGHSWWLKKMSPWGRKPKIKWMSKNWKKTFSRSKGLVQNRSRDSARDQKAEKRVTTRLRLHHPQLFGWRLKQGASWMHNWNGHHSKGEWKRNSGLKQILRERGQKVCCQSINSQHGSRQFNSFFIGTWTHEKIHGHFWFWHRFDGWSSFSLTSFLFSALEVLLPMSWT